MGTAEKRQKTPENQPMHRRLAKTQEPSLVARIPSRQEVLDAGVPVTARNGGAMPHSLDGGMPPKRAAIYVCVSTATKFRQGDTTGYEQNPAVQEQPLRHLVSPGVAGRSTRFTPTWRAVARNAGGEEHGTVLSRSGGVPD